MRYVLPKGYFRGAPPQTLVVSKRFGTGHNDTMYIRSNVGKGKFNRLARAHGLVFPGDSPMESTYRCEGLAGVPGTKYADPRPCSGIQCLPVVISPDDPDLPFHRHVCCQRCHRAVASRQREALKLMESSGEPMSGKQTQRLHKLNDQQTRHQQRYHISRQAKAEEFGMAVVQADERKKNSRNQARKAAGIAITMSMAELKELNVHSLGFDLHRKCEPFPESENTLHLRRK